MLTVLGYALLAIVLVAGLFFLGATLLPAGEQLAPAVRDEPHWALSHGRAVRAEDVENVRLPVALRGYRFAETDELLDTLAEQIRWRDAELARLQAAAGPSDASAGLATGPAASTADDTGEWARPAAVGDASESMAAPVPGAADGDAVGDAPDEAAEEAAVRDHLAPRATE